MFRKKGMKLVALTTALCLLLALTGCAMPQWGKDRQDKDAQGDADTAPAKPTGTAKPSQPPQKPEGYDTRHVRADLDFSELVYEHYDIDWYAEYTDPLFDFAENGGTEKEFVQLEADCYAELLYIDTMMTLAKLRSDTDVTDAEADEENLYTYDVWIDAMDSYCIAMQAVATSPYANVMLAVFDEATIQDFADYEPVTEEEKKMALDQEALVLDYFALMGEDDPDLDEAVELYLELVELRKQEAAYYEYDSYADYMYEEGFCRDYTPQDIQPLLQGVKDVFVPFAAESEELLYDAAPTVFDWYGSSDIDCGEDAIFASMEQVLPRLAPELSDALTYMRQHHLYDIAPSDVKADVGYTTHLSACNAPFIFYSPYDCLYDYTTIYHEFGHYVNFFYTEHDLVNGESDYDLAELQSQGMELLFTFFYDELFDEETADSMRTFVLLNLADSVVQGAMYDDFQQRVYAAEDLTAEDVLDIFYEVYEAYMGYTYEGCEYAWVYVPHNFQSPFYYISYCVSALGVLELYRQCVEDWDTGLELYLSASAMDTEAFYYSEALKALGLRDIFDPKYYPELTEVLQAQLA